MKYLARAVFALATAGGILVGPAVAQSPDASGKWDVVLNAPDGPHKATLTLKIDAGKLTGSIGNSDGEIAVEGNQTGSDVTVSFTYKGGDGPMLITMKGVHKGNSIAGDAKFGDAAGDWTATRAGSSDSAAGGGATSALDISGAWVFEVNFPGGSGTPTITFTQNGEKLTGQYVGGLGEAPIQGTLKGSELTFSFDVTFQDTKLHVVYSGTATEDALKGTASFGDMGEGTFTAKRK
jgi:hypothetical protein